MNETLLTVLLSAALVLGVLLSTRILNRHMKKSEYSFKPWLNYLLTGGITVLLLLLGGISLWTVKGCAFCLILLYAAIEDHTKQEADNWLWVMLVILSLVGFDSTHILSMLLGAVAVFIPQLIVEVFCKKIHIGGADMKVSACAALVLGFYKGTVGFMLGLFIAIVCQLIRDKIKGQSTKEPFPLLPYLSVGLMIGYESENEYAGNQLETTEGRIARNTAYGASKVGNWGIRETQKNIQKWRNRPMKLKVNEPKKLPPPQRKVLPSPQRTAKTAKNAQKTAKATAKATKQAAKATVKASKRAIQAAKKAAQLTVKAVKVAVKAIVAAVKATIAAVKGIIAAIAAGGWVAVLVIVIICMVALVVGSVFAIFLPGEKEQEMTLQTVMYDLNHEYGSKIGELQSEYTYDYCVFDGEKALSRDVIAVYAVKVNADPQKPDEVFSMTDKKAKILSDVFWTINKLSAYTEEKTETETHYETDSEGNTVKKQVEVKKVYLHIVTDTITPYEAAKHFDFNDKQNKTLTELLDPYYDDMWAALSV